MESDNSKNKKYPTGRIISPFFYNGAYNCDFTFFYNLYNISAPSSGDSGLQLNVYYRKYGRDTLLAKTSQMTSNKWKEQKVTLPHCPKDFNVSLLFFMFVKFMINGA